MLREEKPTLLKVNQVLRQIYPYSLEMAGITEDRRGQLIEGLEQLKRLDSREMMLIQKQDELDHLGLSNKQLSAAKSLLPTLKESETFWENGGIENYKVVETTPGGHLDKHYGILFASTYTVLNIMRGLDGV